MRQSYSIPSSLSESLNNTKNSAISYIRSTRCLSPARATAIPAGIPACLAIIPLECKCRAGSLQVGWGIGGGLVRKSVIMICLGVGIAIPQSSGSMKVG